MRVMQELAQLTCDHSVIQDVGVVVDEGMTISIVLHTQLGRDNTTICVHVAIGPDGFLFNGGKLRKW